MLRVLVYAIPIILAVYALVDCIQTEEKAVRGLPKLAWVAVIALIWVIGPVAWLVAGRDRSGHSSVRPGTPGPAGPRGGDAGRQTRRVVAPDDDPDFLRQLGRDRDRRRREEQARGERAADAGSPGATGAPGPADETDPDSGDTPRA